MNSIPLGTYRHYKGKPAFVDELRQAEKRIK